MVKDGVARSTWWFGYGNCETDGNMSSSLYGWQNFGGYEIFEAGTSNYGCNGTNPKVRAYASTYGGGYALMLFNLDENAAVRVPVKIAGVTSGERGSTWTYDKSIYDLTKNNVWNGPRSAKLPSWKNYFTVTLPPWSMVVVQTK